MPKQKKYLSPAFLQKGDTVALVSPAGFIPDVTAVKKAEATLLSWGFVPVKGNFITNKKGIYAGSDKERLSDLQKALDNPEIKAIWALRGGYGSVRIAPELQFEAFIKNPKWLIGFSDITVLHAQLQQLGYKSLHAMMPIQITDSSPEVERALKSLYDSLTGKDLEYIIPASNYNIMGSVKGVLTGGNLSIIQSLVGTAYELKTKDKVVFIEEIGESLYRIDRLLQSLKLAGFFKGIKALVVGSFSDIPAESEAYGGTYQDLIVDLVKDYDFPVLFDVPAGHIPDNRALIFGQDALVKVGEFVSCIRFEHE